MSKRLNAAKYARQITFLEGVRDDPNAGAKSRMIAALKLQEFYLAFEIADSKAKEHSRKLELRKLQVENPTLPLPDSSPASAPSPATEAVDETFDYLRKGGKSATV
jgi:hypothetical protein